MKPYKNEAEVDFSLRTYLTNELKYAKKWVAKKCDNQFVQNCLRIASKQQTAQRGEPDLIYVNEQKKILILIENKDSINDHGNQDHIFNPAKYAIDGVLHYLSFFTSLSLLKQDEATRTYFRGWHILGIAFSGNIYSEYEHLISTFLIEHDQIKEHGISELLNEEDYLSLFENIDTETLILETGKTSSEINNLLRNIDTDKRPILLSALMISLYPEPNNWFKDTYTNMNGDTLVESIPIIIKFILVNQHIPESKINILLDELIFLKNIDKKEILKTILNTLQNKIIPLFSHKSNYDIVGRFYEEFLRYAGITNVKKGIVLTPHHITSLFTELIDIKTNDVILDACCGTGAFLIAGMHKIIETIKNSSLKDKSIRIDHVKQDQLIGFEISPTMYALAISNMLFRGDGKSRIYHIDFFSDEADKVLDDLKKNGIVPSIGFINPPYGGKDNPKSNPTKKEIQFIAKLLDHVTRYVVVIAPFSTYFSDDSIRNNILAKHTLKYVINMPKDLFMPNASINTAIAVFETNIPQGKTKTLMYNLLDDGFVLSKNRGRRDIYNKWDKIKSNLLNRLACPQDFINDNTFISTSLSNNDEWIIQAHSKIDFAQLIEDDFARYVKRYVYFEFRKKLGLLEKEIEMLDLYDLIAKNIKKESAYSPKKKMNLSDVVWKEFILYSDETTDINNSQILFEIEKGERLTETDRIQGETPLITASSYNNGITSMIDKEIFHHSKKIHQNRLTIDMFANVFYHNYEYFSDDNVHTLSFRNKNYTKYCDNIYIGLFLATIIQQLKSKFDFGRQVRMKRLSHEIIKLPVTNEGEINWFFMERYIKSLPYSINL